MTIPESENVVRRNVRIASGLVCFAILAMIVASGVFWLVGQFAGRSDKTVGPDVDRPPLVNEPPWFVDVTQASGLSFTYRNGEEAGELTILESMGGGVALIDFDGDGLLDVFVTGGGFFDGSDHRQIKGRPCKLYRNLGNWKFSDITESVGLNVPWFYTNGTAVADYDRDGWPDLLVTGYGQLRLFHNEPGDKEGRRFVDVTQVMGLGDKAWSTSAGWADLDGDGFPDLYVCHYVDWSFANNPVCPGFVPGVKRDVCSPTAFQPQVHSIFHNEHGRNLRDVSSDHGLKANGRGLGVVLADLNDDGRPDIYVANDLDLNFLFFNRGGKLEEKGLLAGAAVDDNGNPNSSMGVDIGDYDGSGRPALWVTNFQRETHGLYRNCDHEEFVHHSRAAGVAAIGQNFVGFGTGFIDVDNDGWEDLVIVNGHVFRHVPNNNDKQRPVLLRNTEFKGRRFFQDASSQGGPFFQAKTFGRGLAIGDLDNDGWPDLVVSHNNSPIAILRNEAANAMNKPHRWLGVRLVGRDHRDVVGSTVTVEESTRTLTRFVKGGGSYLSANDPRLLFGLGDSAEVRRVKVKWSWGETQSWENLDLNKYWELREGEPDAREPSHATY